MSANFQGTPIICGGSSYNFFPKICYGFSNGQWKEFAEIKKARRLAAGIMHKNKFHIFGGDNGTWDLLNTR